MAITIFEKQGSGVLSDTNQTSLYVLNGTTSEAAALIALKAATPLLFGNLKRGVCRVRPAGPSVWDCEVPYNEIGRPDTNESEFSFDTTGATQHLTQSLETIKNYAPKGQEAPDFHGCIGVTEDAIEGVDWPMPRYAWTETHYLPTELLTGAYTLTLAGMTGTLNRDKWRGWPKGTIRFDGATGSGRNGEDSAITFRFEFSPTKDALTVGEIQGIRKEGWHYLWIRYLDDEDADAKTLVKRPASAHVERIGDYSDFRKLLIG